MEHSAKQFASALVRDTIVVPIPDLDKGCCDYPNVKAVVLESHSDGHLWKLGCKAGVLDQCCTVSINSYQLRKSLFFSVFFWYTVFSFYLFNWLHEVKISSCV